MAKQYSVEYKAEAVKMVLEKKESQNRIAGDLGIACTMLYGWV